MSNSAVIPFGNLINRIRNQEDDDFDPTYGDPDNMMGGDDANTRDGLALILMTCIFLFILVVLRYGCIWFIDVVILCEHRRNPRTNNHDSRCRRVLSLCCPRWFPPPEEDPGDLEGGPRDPDDDDDPTATNTNSNSSGSSDGDSSQEDGMEMVRASNNSNYAKRLMKILREDQKRSLFAIVLDNRTVTKSDVSEMSEAWGDSEDSRNFSPAETTRENQAITSDNMTSTDGGSPSSLSTSPPSSSSSSMVVPDGGPTITETPLSTTTTTTATATNAICCPICIQDIKVGDRVCHSKRKNCHHLFHFDCILEWLGTGSTLCPYCRREIFTRRMLEEAYQQIQPQRQQQQQQSSKK